MASEHHAGHTRTLEQVFEHPMSHNIEWKDVVRLLDAVGTVKEEHNGKFHVTVKDETVILHRPKHDIVETEQLVQIRHFLERAGLKPS
jgi:hypothetical protein